MTQPEFLAWAEFYKLHPFDDLHRYHRPAALIGRSMSGADVEDLLDWLAPDPKLAKLSPADRATMKALGMRRN
jgi:hypothetical protein